jgi:hypothetical protein
MSRKTWWTAALVVAGMAAPAFGQVKQVKLEWKLKPKDHFYLETNQTVKQTVTVSGRSMKSSLTSNVISHLTVKKSTKDSLVLEQQFVSAQLSSAGDFSSPDLEDAAKRLKDQTLTFTLDAAGKVTKVSGYDGLIDKLTRDNKEAGKLYRLLFPEESFKAAVEDLFVLVPPKGGVPTPRKGAKWTKAVTLPVIPPPGSLGSFKHELTFTPKGKTEEGQEIAVSSKASYVPPKGEGSAPVKITKADFTTQKFEGTLVFDTSLGRLARSEMKAEVKGKLTMEVSDREEQVSVELTTDTTSQVTQKKPSTSEE